LRRRLGVRVEFGQFAHRPHHDGEHPRIALAFVRSKVVALQALFDFVHLAFRRAPQPADQRRAHVAQRRTAALDKGSSRQWRHRQTAAVVVHPVDALIERADGQLALLQDFGDRPLAAIEGLKNAQAVVVPQDLEELLHGFQ